MLRWWATVFRQYCISNWASVIHMKVARLRDSPSRFKIPSPRSFSSRQACLVQLIVYPADFSWGSHTTLTMFGDDKGLEYVPQRSCLYLASGACECLCIYVLATWEAKICRGTGQASLSVCARPDILNRATESLVGWLAQCM